MSRYAGRPTMPSYTPTHNGNGSSNSSINRPHTPTRTPSLNNLNVNGRDGPATPLPNLPPTLNSLPAADPLGTLKNSQNTVAAGFGEALAALVQAASTPPAPTQPIFVEWENRVMALGRKRMAGLGSGKNAFLYLKSKFGLLSSSRPLYLQATFFSMMDGEYVELDLDAWEELAPYIEKLRIIA